MARLSLIAPRVTTQASNLFGLIRLELDSQVAANAIRIGYAVKVNARLPVRLGTIIDVDLAVVFGVGRGRSLVLAMDAATGCSDDVWSAIVGVGGDTWLSFGLCSDSPHRVSCVVLGIRYSR